MSFRIIEQTYRGAVRWILSHIHPDGGETTLGHYRTRTGARNAAGLLGGRGSEIRYA